VETGTRPARADGAHTRPFDQLRAPTRGELYAAHRAGRDPNELLHEFRDRYDAAVAETSGLILELGGDDGARYAHLGAGAPATGDARREEWRIEPVRIVAELLNPTAKTADLDRLSAMVRGGRYVGHTLTFVPRERVRVSPLRRLDRRLGCGRPRARARRTASSRAGPSDDSGSEPPGETAGPPLLYLVHPRFGKVNGALARFLKGMGS